MSCLSLPASIVPVKLVSCVRRRLLLPRKRSGEALATDMRAVVSRRARRGWTKTIILTGLFAIAGSGNLFAQTCPGATPNDPSDDYSALQACLNAGGTVRLDAGYYWISQTLDLTQDYTILTNNGGARPSIHALPGLDGPMLEVFWADYWEIRNIQFGGMLYTRDIAWKCGLGQHRKFGDNLFVNGNGWKIDNISSGGALCGSALEVEGGWNFEITNSQVGGNGRSLYENTGINERWSDGITLLVCNGGYVANNMLIDNTDVHLIVGGGYGCVIQNNYIRNYEKYAYAGFMSGNFPNAGGDHPNSVYRYNDIGSSYNQLAFGIMVGFHPWNAAVPVYWAGEIVENSSFGAVVNLAIDGISSGYIHGNALWGAQGNQGYGCTLSADYTAGDYGSANFQTGWVPRIYHPC